MKSQVMIVEDEEGLIAQIQTELEFENYDVIVAKTGLSAMQLFEQFKSTIGVVLLDWMIPELNGLEVLRRIRRQTTTLPIIFVTARDYVGDKVAGLDSGADDYITNPFEIEELLARLRVIFRHQQQLNNPPDTYDLGTLAFKVKAHQIMNRDNKEMVQLTQRENKLLLLLLNYRNEVVTRDKLLDEVWGIDFVGQTNIVDVYIRYLRNKLAKLTDQPLIKTVRGVGYCLEG